MAKTDTAQTGRTTRGTGSKAALIRWSLLIMVTVVVGEIFIWGTVGRLRALQ